MALEELAKKYGFRLQSNNKDDYYFKPTFVNWGGKGVGKTSFAYGSFTGTIVVLSYDGKSRYILANYKPDWFLIDGEDLLVQHCEMYMRKRQGLSPFEGFKNTNLWKERNAFVRQLHRMGLKNAKVGVIYNTTYQIEEVERQGEIKRIETPKWVDIVMYEADFAFHIFTATDPKSGREHFFAKVSTTKYDKIFPYGKIYDVTDHPVLVTPMMFSRPLVQQNVTNASKNEVSPPSVQPPVEIENKEKEDGEFWDV